MLKWTVSIETLKLEKFKPPTWLWLSPTAREVWNKKLNELAALGWMGDIDIVLLALFCDAVARYMGLSTKQKLSISDHRALQRDAKIILRSAEELGFTPLMRASMAKNRGSSLVQRP